MRNLYKEESLLPGGRGKRDARNILQVPAKISSWPSNPYKIKKKASGVAYNASVIYAVLLQGFDL